MFFQIKIRFFAFYIDYVICIKKIKFHLMLLIFEEFFNYKFSTPIDNILKICDLIV